MGNSVALLTSPPTGSTGAAPSSDLISPLTLFLISLVVLFLIPPLISFLLCLKVQVAFYLMQMMIDLIILDLY